MSGASMEVMFSDAEREGLWFYTSYQQLWFAPAELRKHQAEGRYLWGAQSWILRPPSILLREIDERIAGLQRERETTAQRIEASRRRS